MALTAAETVDVRRYAGYPAAGSPPADDALAVALAGLSAEGESVIRTTFLPALAAIEIGLTGSSSILDTAKAAVWERNPAELVERALLYRTQRIALCRFLGVEPGPGVYDPLPVVVPDDPSGGVALPPAVFVV